MNTLSIPVVAMASISLYVGFYHLFIYFRRRTNHEDLTFALLCFAIVFYDAFCVGLYNATSVLEGARWQRAQLVALAVFVIAFLWFMSDYTSQKPSLAIHFFWIFYLLAIFVQLVDRSDLTFPLDQPSIKYITLPFVHPVTYYEVTLGLFSTAQSLLGLVASTYILIMGIRYFRRGYKREAIPLILAILFMYLAGLNDTLVSNGVYDFIYLIEYAYLAVILLMASSLSNTVMEAAMAKEELRKSEERFRSLVETTSDWVWEVNASGVYTYSSPTVHDLLGYEPEEVIGRTPFDLMPAAEAERVHTIVQDLMIHKKPIESLENVARCKDGNLIVLETSGVPFFDETGKLSGYRGIDRDITERKQAEAQIKRALRETRVHFEVSQALAGTETEDEVLDALIQHAGLYPQAFVAIFIFDRRAGELLAIVRRQELFESGLTASMSLGESLPASRYTLFGHFSADQPFVSEDVRVDERFEPTGLEILKQTGVASFAAIPLTVGNEWMGYIGVMAKVSGYFDEEKLHLYQTLAEQGAVALRAAHLRETIRESQRRLSLLVEQSPLAVIEWNMDFKVASWNPAAAQIFGYTRAEALGHHGSFIVPEGARPLVNEVWQSLLERRGEIHSTNENLTQAGDSITCEWFNAPLIGADGQMIGVVSLVQDVTERKRAEEAIRSERQRFQTILETTRVPTIISRLSTGEVVYANQAIVAVSQVDLKKLIGFETLSFYANPDDRKIVLDSLQKHGHINDFEVQFRRTDGSLYWALLSARIFDYEGEPCVLSTYIDISERKRMEEALRESEQKFRLFIEQSSDGLVFTDEHGIIIEWNHAQEHLTGVSREESIGRSLWETQLDLALASRQRPEYRKELERRILAALQSGEADFLDKPMEIALFRRDGVKVIVQQVTFSIKTIQGYRLGSINRDITQLKQAEEELKASEEKYRRLVEVSPTATWIAKNDIITYVNPAAMQILGATDPGEVVGRNALDFIHLDYHPLVKERISQMKEKGNTVPLLEEKYLRLDGRIIDVEVVATPFITPAGPVIQVFFQDITKRKQAEEALQQANLVVENSPVVLFRWRAAEGWPVVMVSQNVIQFGYTPDGLLSGEVPYASLVHPEDLDRVVREVQEHAFSGKDRFQQEYRIVTKDGGIRWIDDRTVVERNANGQVTFYQGIIIDITERKHMEDVLFEEKERAEITLQSIGDAVITTDIHARVEYINPIAETLTGWKVEEAAGRHLLDVFQIIEEVSRQPAINPVERCLKEDRVVGLANHSILIRRDGREFSIDDSAAPIRNRDGEMIGAVLVFHDVTEERRLSRQVAHDAMHDSLTGLVNRREFEKRLERALTNIKEHNISHILCYLDLDQFKIVNDTAGHAAGDELLRQISGLLAGLFRQRDTLARLGGDEFGLLLENCQLDQALIIANEIKGKIRNFPFVWAGHGFQVGVSIGVVPITAEKESVNQLLSQADVACYSAKDLGRDRIYVYHAEDSETTQRHSEILQAARMRDAILQDQFRLFCQPIIQVTGENREIIQYEVLLRMTGRDGLLVLPSAFIPSAERYGLMHAIDRWVIRETFDIMSRHDIERMLININLSGHTLDDETLLEYVLEQLNEFSIPPDHICFEITETAAIHHLNKAQQFIYAFRDRGGKIALDDFGSGFSSFRYLKRLPVDYIKIDGSFVSDMLSNPGDLLMVEAITKIAHTLGIEIIAEHASSLEIIDHLRELGVDRAQGYGVGHAIPVEDAWGSRRQGNKRQIGDIDHF